MLNRTCACLCFYINFLQWRSCTWSAWRNNRRKPSHPWTWRSHRPARNSSHTKKRSSLWTAQLVSTGVALSDDPAPDSPEGELSHRWVGLSRVTEINGTDYHSQPFLGVSVAVVSCYCPGGARLPLLRWGQGQIWPKSSLLPWASKTFFLSLPPGYWLPAQELTLESKISKNKKLMLHFSFHFQSLCVWHGSLMVHWCMANIFVSLFSLVTVTSDVTFRCLLWNEGGAILPPCPAENTGQFTPARCAAHGAFRRCGSTVHVQVRPRMYSHCKLIP